MKKNSMKSLISLLLPCFLIIGCTKDYTKYYADAEDPDIAIFSNKNNNALSCFINGKPWRTVSRKTSGFINPGTNYEVDIIKQPTNTLRDTLLIRWVGYYSGNYYSQGSLSLHLAIPKNFTYRYLSALQGQRLNIDSASGYFFTGISQLNNGNTKGSGNIYFNISRFDSISPNVYTGKLSGLFEADFTSFKITKGRFDHIIFGPEQIRF